MADTVGQQDLRGIDIDKLAKGFADEEFIFKKFLSVSPTSAREIRWYQKTSGTLDSTDTSGITSSQIPGISQLALPEVGEQSATRNTSYVRKYMFESPWLAWEDVRDSDLDMLAINVRDITRAVVSQVDSRIYGQLSGGLALSGAAMGTGWGDTTNGNPIVDILSGAKAIRTYNYDISNLVILMHPADYKDLMSLLIVTKGTSWTGWAGDRLEQGVLMKLLGYRLVVSNNATENFAVMIVPNRVATWKQFAPITTVQITEPGIGVKIRAWEEGEIILTDPQAGYTIQGV